MDRPDFDAHGHFDGVVEKGMVRDVLKSANAVDAEVKDLDGDMQMVCYENYNKFIRATEVTALVKSSVDNLAPDIGRLEKSFAHISEHQRKVEETVSGRAREIELLLKRQRRCKKLQALFELPTTLQRCLDREAYGKACEAYSTCTPFLRQYKHVNTFRSVLEASDLQMSRIKTALEWRLRAPDLCSKDAMHSSATLLDLGESPSKVARDYLSGRGAAFRARLSTCFTEGEEQAASEHLLSACHRAAAECSPEVADAVEGFGRLREGREISAEGFDPDAELSSFVVVSVESLLHRIASVADRRRPPIDALVAGVSAVHKSLQRLRSSMPRLLDETMTTFLVRLATDAVRSRFSAAAAGLSAELVALRAEVARVQEKPTSSRLVAANEAVSRTEEALESKALVAVDDCGALLGLLESEPSACQPLVQALQDQLAYLGYSFCDACRICMGQELRRGSSKAQQLPEELQPLACIDWSGLFALSLVRIGRRLDEQALAKARASAHELLAGSGAVAAAVSASSTGAALAAAVDSLVSANSGAHAELATAAEATLSHYVFVAGQKCAYLLRTSVKQAAWAQAAAAPADPSAVVEALFKEVAEIDEELGHFLGGATRNPQGTSPKARRGGGRKFASEQKDAMELELERQWARKLKVFSPVAFSRSAGIAGVLRIAFKALFEYAREETFSKFGLQQLQLDCALFRELSRDLVEGEEETVALEGLLAEAVGSAASRCASPELIQADALGALVSEKKPSLRLD